MSVWTKRMAVIKQVNSGCNIEGKSVSGIIRIEEGESSTSVSLSLMNILSKQSGTYYAVIKGVKDEMLIFDMGGFPMTYVTECDGVCDIKEGIACLIIYAEGENVSAVAYASSGSAVMGINDLKGKFVADYLLPKLTPKIEYADEAVAESNYYEKEDLSKFTLGFDEAACAETEIPNTDYYDNSKEELDGLFAKFPQNRELNKLIPNSKWVKVSYGGEKYYTVGLIFEKEAPKYICYGVPGRYSKTPPKALDGYSSFLPLSLFDMLGDGYWMMYQNASTGDCVKVDIIR